MNEFMSHLVPLCKCVETALEARDALFKEIECNFDDVALLVIVLDT